MAEDAPVIGRAGLLAAGLLLGLGLAEMLARVVLPPRSGSELRRLHELRPDRPWLYGMRPNAVVDAGGVRYTVNADGFRGLLATRPRPASALRIVALGDSVTLGYGVDEPDGYPAQLAARLAETRPGRSVEVLNLGVSGYNPYTEAALFADVGPAYDPDVVLVQFCINDLNDPTMHFDASTMAALGPLPDAAFPDPATRRPPARRFDCRGIRLCELVVDAVAAPRADPVALRAGLRVHEAASDVEMAWIAARYADIGRTAAALGARPVLVVFPHAGQLAPGASAAVGARLAEVGSRLGWPVIDLVPAFQAAARDGAALFSDVWHPTAAGHRLAAKVVAEELARRGVLDGGDADSGRRAVPGR